MNNDDHTTPEPQGASGWQQLPMQDAAAGDNEPYSYQTLVYVFDSNEDKARHLAYALEMYSHETIAFSNLEEFRSAIFIRTPHAAIVDIDSEDGKLAKKAFGARIATVFPVIFTSCEDSFQQRLTAVREGADGYFIKPLDVEALSARIDEKIAKNEVHAYRVLIIEDEESQAAFYDAILSSAGMHVKAINSPAEVLDVMKKFKPELILTDLHMPVCTGIELSKLIRQNNQYLDIPIVFLSGETNTERQVSAIEAGADDFLVKPIDPETLIAAISTRAERYRVLRKHRHP
ncbi:MAG: response regulator [Pseudomonadota bacterium]